MGIFSTIGAVFGSNSGTVFMFIVLAVSDHLWGENVFNCPCGAYRILYTLAFLVVPPVVIIFIDTSWRVLFGTCQMCCDEWDEGGSDHQPQHHRRCDRCCSCCCNCSRATCEILVRLFIRPLIIALLWLIFSCMEPKFGRCLYKEVQCNCTHKEIKDHQCNDEAKARSAAMRVFMACVCLGFTCVAIFVGILYVLCKTCIRCYRRRSGCFRICRLCRCWKYHPIKDDDNSTEIRELSKCLYTFGIKPKTVICLHKEKMMSERRLMLMSDISLRHIGRKIGIGQHEILMEHRKNLRLARWMLAQKYTPDSIRMIVEKENFLGCSILDTLRESLHNQDMVDDTQRQLLEDTLRKRDMGHLLPAALPEDSPYQGAAADENLDEFYMVRKFDFRV